MSEKKRSASIRRFTPGRDMIGKTQNRTHRKGIHVSRVKNRQLKFRKYGLFPIIVALIASSGLAYELIAGTLATYLMGSSVTQFSFATGWFLASMGIGSYATKYVRRLLKTFVHIQLSLGIFGGYSALLMFAVFTWTDSFYTIFFLNALLLGVLIGAEIPIVIRIVRRYRLLRIALAHVLALDYLGALITSLAFPLLLLPFFGLIRTALIFGAFNLFSAGLITLFFSPHTRRRYLYILFACFLILIIGFIWSEKVVTWLEAEMYQDPIIYAQTTKYQRVVITRWQDDIRLYLDGDLQFSSRDEHRYHEALVHVPIAFLPRAPERVLILGGGDGLTLREMLRYDSVRTVTLVELDPFIVHLFSTKPYLTVLNKNAFHDARVHVIYRDAFQYIKQLPGHIRYDVIIADLPDPDNYTVNRLYTVEFYTMVFSHLQPGGIFVTQATSPIYGSEAFACIESSMKKGCAQSIRCTVRAYHVYIPSFGDWGFIMAGDRLQTPVAYRFEGFNEMVYLTPEIFPSLFLLPEDFLSNTSQSLNYLNNPRLVYLYEKSWARWFD